jgi:hypothetical protein
MDTSTLPWVLQQLTVVGFIGLAGGMANWREKNRETVSATRDVVDAARALARLKQGDMARALEMDEGQWSRSLRDGGNLTALVVIGIRHPVFGAALVGRLGELLRGASESPEERVERLIRDLHNQLPQRACKKCEQVSRQRDSSAA